MAEIFNVVVIGGGPAGMMAAIAAAAEGKSVCLIERNAQLGRKLLATGNGRCNLTNTDLSICRYHGGDPRFVETVLTSFDQHSTLSFFNRIGLLMKEEDQGRVFPRTNQASSVVQVLQQELARSGVVVLLDCVVVGVEKLDSWRVHLYKKAEVQAERLIIATGGKAAHHFGSTGDGWLWARQFGHSLTEHHPALVPVETVEKWPRELQGLRIEVKSWATCEGELVGEGAGDVLFTGYGMSGPAVMALSGAIAPPLRAHEVTVHMDVLPDLDEEELPAILHRLLSVPDKTASETLIGLLPDKIIPVVLGASGIALDLLAGALSDDRIRKLSRTLKALTVTVSKLRPFKEAQVTAGGLDLSQIDPNTLESKLVDGLYFAGEIVDVDGDSGGFNLQWAWSSGYVAGKAAAKEGTAYASPQT